MRDDEATANDVLAELEVTWSLLRCA